MLSDGHVIGALVNRSWSGTEERCQSKRKGQYLENDIVRNWVFDGIVESLK